MLGDEAAAGDGALGRIRARSGCHHTPSGGEVEGVAERRSGRGSAAALGAPAAARVVHDDGRAVSVPPPAALRRPAGGAFGRECSLVVAAGAMHEPAFH